MTNYRLDRRYVLPAIGLHFIAAGIASALAFFVWGPLGVLVGLLLLNGARLAAFPPRAVRTDASGAVIGGSLLRKGERIVWADVDDVSVGRTNLYLTTSDDQLDGLPLGIVGARADELVRDVYERLNAANGYTRFDPTT